MKIYAVVYFDSVSYCSEYYGFYSTKEKAEQGMQVGQADEEVSYAEDWCIKEIVLDK
jgi:hypothetical protein